jgi:hypothetical protein
MPSTAPTWHRRYADHSAGTNTTTPWNHAEHGTNSDYRTRRQGYANHSVDTEIRTNNAMPSMTPTWQRSYADHSSGTNKAPTLTPCLT